MKGSTSAYNTHYCQFNLRIKTESLQISYDSADMWKLKKNDASELIYKTEIDSQTENKLMVTKGGRDKLGIWD